MGDKKTISKKAYKKELKRLQLELIKLQSWAEYKKLKIIVVFEGRDAAGKGGTIKRITKGLNHRFCTVAALPVPTEREKSQWYFQRYISHFPAEGEMVIFDRSWYNRAGVEKVMGFCDDDEYQMFLRDCPRFEKLLVDSGIILIKYWFSVSQKEQEKRLRERNEDVTKRWKLGSIDIASREKWDEYSKARDIMLEHTDTKDAPWYIVDADVKMHARLNCISHLLSMFDYKDETRKKIDLPDVPKHKYKDVAYKKSRIVPDIASKLIKE
jgi:polyphosphate kinase 2